MQPITNVLVAPTAERKTPPSGFASTLRAAAAATADGIAAAAGIAAPIAPVGMVLAGAIRGAVQAGPAPARGASAPPPGGGAPAAGPFPAAAGAASGDPFEAARLLQTESQSFNMRYLALQEGLQRESREFTALSNTLKVRHDAARAAIQNIQ
jgi:hypothetical protein